MHALWMRVPTSSSSYVGQPFPSLEIASDLSFAALQCFDTLALIKVSNPPPPAISDDDGRFQP
ncbi:hypothetical protein AQ878_12160 [Burkholderia pseudomallei]|nr:hypothetical protein AQ878_12160 [Burkholderia pseudomallei]